MFELHNWGFSSWFGLFKMPFPHPAYESVSPCSISQRNAFVSFPVRKTPAIQRAPSQPSELALCYAFPLQQFSAAISCKTTYRGCQLIYWAINRRILYGNFQTDKSHVGPEQRCQIAHAWLSCTWLSSLLCKGRKEGRGWKAARRAPTDVWSYIKIRWPKLFS